MAFFSFGRRVKPKKYDYIPQHYDPIKEDLERRLAKYGGGEMTDADLAKERIRGGIRMKARGNKEVLRKGTRAANIRLAITFIIVVAISYYVITSDGFNAFLNRILT